MITPIVMLLLQMAPYMVVRALSVVTHRDFNAGGAAPGDHLVLGILVYDQAALKSGGVDFRRHLLQTEIPPPLFFMRGDAMKLYYNPRSRAPICLYLGETRHL